MMRTSREFVGMQVAYAIAQRGTCDRKQVGAVITHDGRPISWGYNGAPPKMPHCSENMHGWGTERGAELIDWQPWKARGTQECGDYVEEWITDHGCRNATHAEANALAFAARQGISTDGGTLFVTCSPCDVCARLLIAAGIDVVYYDEEYRDPAGRELLERAGVLCQHISSH